MDVVYENFVYQIAGEALQALEDESLQDAVEKAEKVRELNRKIEQLKARIRKEKQFNVQVKLNTKLKKLKKELETQTNG
jgi:predicted RNase H-like nuclease (RuvC/YqgF family)